MPRPRKNPVTTNPRDAAQLAVSNAGAALAAMIKALDENGVHLTQTEFERAFCFVHYTIAVLEAQARKDRVIKTAGKFSFEEPIPTITVMETAPAPVQPAPAATPAPVAPPAQSPPVPVPAPPETNSAEAQVRSPFAGVPATPAGAPIRHFTGRVSRHAQEANAGMPVRIALRSEPLKGEVADAADNITLLTE